MDAVNLISAAFLQWWKGFMCHKGQTVNNRVTSYLAGDRSALVRSDGIPHATQILKGKRGNYYGAEIQAGRDEVCS